mmetsp:Transcript_2537/g.5333  ORF Transcript_2537/g.5333 Transcript_2537/m.5333 type:complete len:163 (+) Transcript_2537:411-899(+)
MAADKKSIVGHTKSYVQVVLDAATAPLCGVVDVEITSVERWCCQGRVVATVDVAPTPTPAVIPHPPPRVESHDPPTSSVPTSSSACGTDCCSTSPSQCASGGCASSACCGGSAMPPPPPPPPRSCLVVSAVAVAVFWAVGAENPMATALGLALSCWVHSRDQ